MSIRTHADSAIAQGKLAAEQANQFVGSLADRAGAAVGGLRAQAEKTLPIDSIKSVVEPYVGRAREQIQKQLQTVTSYPRVAKAVATAETVAGVVTDTIIKPVAGRVGLADKPVSKPAATATRKPAAARPATKPAAKKSGATGAAPSTAEQ